MANDKKSSIYDGQSVAGSASELDEYGVWVKSDPVETSASEKGDADFPIFNDESSPDFEIGEIEEVSVDELNAPVVEGIDDFEKEFIPGDLGSEVEDLASMSFDAILDPEADDMEKLQVEDILKADSDFLAVENQKITEVPTIDALSLGAEMKEAADEAASSEDAFENAASGENDAVSEESSVYVKDASKRGATELFIENFLDDSPFDDDEIPLEEKSAEAEEGGGDAVALDGGASEEGAAFEGDAAVSAEAEEGGGDAVAPTVNAPCEAKAEQMTAQSATQTNLSTELLLRIAEELSSIRQELSTLKQDFLVIRSREPVKKTEVPQIAQDGFFDDSDDEKIALTGNEIDNILGSTDFTEEIGMDIFEETAGTSEDALFEIGEVALDSLTESEELRRLREEGVEPITPAPEDSNYLEADTAVHQEMEIEDIDLSDVVIDEPDLSEQVQENPLQEPVLEAIAFDEMPLELSDEDMTADIGTDEISGWKNADEEPLLEIPEESAEKAAVSAETAFGASASEAEPVAKLNAMPSAIQQELKTVLSYMDQLLESLPEEKIEEFAASKYFDTYKKLFSELGLA
ncbi:MAG: hypothetical protein LBG43_10785 [Treponema sp.]|jgi:hypothetical protein|nr:hypothetical protein [Treponema sp.]